jgi:hypothetical protein
VLGAATVRLCACTHGEVSAGSSEETSWRGWIRSGARELITLFAADDLPAWTMTCFAP